jgi:hypothetical protein
MSADAAGPLYTDFVKELQDAEDKRRESLDARGAQVITVSGTLVTLLLALGALVTKRQDFVLDGVAGDLIKIAVIAFGLAALLAIATYMPQPTRITDAAQLQRDLPELWQRSPDYARKRTTVTRTEQLAEAQRANDTKARLLLGAIFFQTVAVGLVAAAVVDLL